MEDSCVNSSPFQQFSSRIAAFLSQARRLCNTTVRKKALRVSHTASLGERRIVAVLEFERQRFLVGASPSVVNLLARLEDAPSEESL